MSLQMCRVCMAKGSNFNKLGTGKDSYASKLYYCVPEIDLTILHNPVICQNCLLMLENAYSLRKKCLLTEKALKARLEESHNKNFESPKNGIKYKNGAVESIEVEQNVIDLCENIGDNVDPLSNGEIGNCQVRHMNLRSVKKEKINNEVGSNCEVMQDNLPESVGYVNKNPDINVAVNVKEERIDIIDDYDMNEELQIKAEPNFDSDKIEVSDRSSRQRGFLMPPSVSTKDSRNRSKGNITKCLKCSRLFKNRGNLKTHMKVHNKFKCFHCLTWFDCKMKLDEHVNNSHSIERAESEDEKRDANLIDDASDTKCKLCSKLFPDKDELTLHEKQHMFCDICDEVFENEATLSVHTSLHSEIEDKSLFQCHSCLQFFTQENYLLNHRCLLSESHFILESKPSLFIQPNVEEQSFPCDICGKIFPTKNRYNIHKRTHSEVLYFCKICNKPYKTQDSLIFHERSHTRPREKFHMCEICNISFESKGLLKNHKYIIHAEEEFYKCSVCSKEFAVKQRLEIHMRVHTGEKPYQCDLCGKCFQIKGSLIVHKKIHTNEKPFQCHNCGKRFITKGNLLMHSRVHTGERPYICTICSRRFTVKNTLIVHIRNKHKHESFDVDFLSDYSDSFHDRLYEKLEAEYVQQYQDESNMSKADLKVDKHEVEPDTEFHQNIREMEVDIPDTINDINQDTSQTIPVDSRDTNEEISVVDDNSDTIKNSEVQEITHKISGHEITSVNKDTAQTQEKSVIQKSTEN